MDPLFIFFLVFMTIMAFSILIPWAYSVYKSKRNQNPAKAGSFPLK
jgi:hypothetical protein